MMIAASFIAVDRLPRHLDGGFTKFECFTVRLSASGTTPAPTVVALADVGSPVADFAATNDLLARMFGAILFIRVGDNLAADFIFFGCFGFMFNFWILIIDVECDPFVATAAVAFRFLSRIHIESIDARIMIDHFARRTLHGGSVCSDIFIARCTKQRLLLFGWCRGMFNVTNLRKLALDTVRGGRSNSSRSKFRIRRRSYLSSGHNIGVVFVLML